MAEIVRLDRIVKQFPGVLANDEVSLEVEEGEIHCLLGENGAGKSTLMNILYGLISHDEGDIIIRGEKVSFTGPGDAIALGIGMVHQHFMLIPVFTVLENLILGSEHVKGLSLDLEKSRKELIEISEKYGMEMNLDAYVRDISVGMQQRVEILKLLYRGADIMIFDEPTAILTPQEIQELYKVMESLRQRGKTIIFITHKLKEVMECSDRVTVLRDGRNVQSVITSTTNTRELARMMVGREVIFNIERPVVEVGKEILRMEDVHAVNSRDLPALNGINLHVSQGEVVGIAGIDGNGQTELVEILTGLRRSVSGTIEIDGHNMRHKTTGDFLNTGTAHIPEDRLLRGLVLDFPIYENMLLGFEDKKPFARGPFLDFQKAREWSEELVEKYDVRTPNVGVTARSLSGGNQQKAVIAREFQRKPKLLIASQPTRGLDVGAIEFVHEQIMEAKKKMTAVLLVSLELSEIMNLSDRILVIYEGKIIGEFKADEATETDLGLLMAGGHNAG
ncbi:MAG: ABC transporter ATP-binding protein [Spirochaetales bacterium]|nr:ABC transporter ATP-binding protein [Spirochaetales bacterium]